MGQLSKEQVATYLRYEPERGNFYWIADTNSRGPSKIGQLAGGLNAINYWQIGLLGQRLLGHRLAWLLSYGYWPKEVDHINNDSSDNRLCNLRECAHARNIAAAHTGAGGYEAHGAKYRARIVVDNVRHELGSFDTLEEAANAYQAARHNLLGEFA